MNFFAAKFEDLHNEPEQLLRQERAAEFEINWIPKLGKNGEVILNKKSGKPRRQYMYNSRLKTCRVKDYLVSLKGCTCRDFRQRQLPCKHMYKLASRVGVFVTKEERSSELIADFSTSYASGWKFAVRPCNYAELDIMMQGSILTQGELYNFVRGEIFYDTPAAYEVQWGDALRVIKYSVQVNSSTPSYGEPVVTWEGKRFVRRNVPNYGLIEFTIYTPNAECTRLEQWKSYACWQNEFVKLLKRGSFVDINGEVIELVWQISK